VTIAALGGLDFTATRPDPTSAEWTITQTGYLGGSLRLTRYASLFFQGRNITNASRIVYASQVDRRGEAPYLVHARNFGASWLFGVKGAF
jgi:hypothetical protein